MCILLNNFLGNSQSNDENITKLRQDYEREVKGKMNQRMVIFSGGHFMKYWGGGRVPGAL